MALGDKSIGVGIKPNLYKLLALYCEVNDVSKRLVISQQVESFLNELSESTLISRLVFQIQEEWEVLKVRNGYKNPSATTRFIEFKSCKGNYLKSSGIDSEIVNTIISKLKV